MDTGIKVGDLMTRNFIHVAPETNLRQCAKTMIKKRVGSLIIKDGDKLKGILTEKDIIWAIVKKSKKDLNKVVGFLNKQGDKETIDRVINVLGLGKVKK